MQQLEQKVKLQVDSLQCHDQKIESNQQFIKELKGSLENVLAEY